MINSRSQLYSEEIESFIVKSIHKEVSVCKFVVRFLKHFDIHLKQSVILNVISIHQYGRKEFAIPQSKLKEFGVLQSISNPSIQRFIQKLNLQKGVHYVYEKQSPTNSKKYTKHRYLFTIDGFENLILRGYTLETMSPLAKQYLVVARALMHFHEYKKIRAEYLFDDLHLNRTLFQ